MSEYIAPHVYTDGTRTMEVTKRFDVDLLVDFEINNLLTCNMPILVSLSIDEVKHLRNQLTVALAAGGYE